ncbi:hypothetical protein PR048_030788 [Dryococelus australis]|uniref:Uncharacterized protein n=1 Tax=Dryococelus australis TaxID=614101 RepID=A0ABQ9GCH5_9NEOP|nr:hypothetical protein PR048_030788 [Dryococelus australis]
MPLVGEFSRGSSVFPALSFLRRSISTSITLVVSQYLDVKSRLNLITSLGRKKGRRRRRKGHRKGKGGQGAEKEGGRKGVEGNIRGKGGEEEKVEEKEKEKEQKEEKEMEQNTINKLATGVSAENVTKGHGNKRLRQSKTNNNRSVNESHWTKLTVQNLQPQSVHCSEQAIVQLIPRVVSFQVRFTHLQPDTKFLSYEQSTVAQRFLGARGKQTTEFEAHLGPETSSDISTAARRRLSDLTQACRVATRLANTLDELWEFQFLVSWQRGLPGPHGRPARGTFLLRLRARYGFTQGATRLRHAAPTQTGLTASRGWYSRGLPRLYSPPIRSECRTPSAVNQCRKRLSFQRPADTSPPYQPHPYTLDSPMGPGWQGGWMERTTPSVHPNATPQPLTQSRDLGGRGKRENPEKTRRPAARFPHAKIREASALAAESPRPLYGGTIQGEEGIYCSINSEQQSMSIKPWRRGEEKKNYFYVRVERREKEEGVGLKVRAIADGINMASSRTP